MELEDGTWCTDGERLKAEAQGFFAQLFATREDVEFTGFPSSRLPSLSTATSETLSEQVSKEEVTLAIHQIGSFKAPGPDGF